MGNLSILKKDTCLICGRKTNLLNKSYKKINNHPICFECIFKIHKQVKNYNELFIDLNPKLLVYLKNEKILAEYVNLRKKYSINDSLWGVYNELKLKYESNKSFSSLSQVLEKMSNLLYKEGKIKSALNFMYSAFYCRYLAVSTIVKVSFGITKLRLLKKMLEKTNTNFSKEEIKGSIYEIIPNFYDENLVNKLYNLIEKEMKENDI